MSREATVSGLCVCCYNAYYECCFLTQFLSCDAWLGTKPTSLVFRMFLAYLMTVLVSLLFKAEHIKL